MKVEFIDKTPLRVTLEAHYFQAFWDGKTYKVPQGFFYDSASIPRLFKFLDDWKNERAYLLHDYLYSKLSDKHQITVSRKLADLQLFSDLQGWERYIIYFGLRLFGGFSYKKDYNYNTYKSIIQDYEKNNTK